LKPLADQILANECQIHAQSIQPQSEFPLLQVPVGEFSLDHIPILELEVMNATMTEESFSSCVSFINGIYFDEKSEV
jgi:hypothetical protein